MAKRQGGWNIPGKQSAGASAVKAAKPEPVRLSQCMIVKNEEKNIERALSWAKNIAFEQIVVDTGSTDRTVEIAERMGAKVYHFTWINDFSAAKNYAIEQATGNWIAFLDADEYFTEDQIPVLQRALNKAQEQNVQNPGEPIHFIRCAWAHLNDEGQVFRVSEQDRLFINDPAIRYYGLIHEQINLPEGKIMKGLMAMHALTIFHNGYTQEAFQETNKLNRNIVMLQQVLEEKPDDITHQMYLADVLFADQKWEQAIPYYMRGLDTEGWDGNMRQMRYENLLRALYETKSDMEAMEKYCNKAIHEFPSNAGYYYYRGKMLAENGDQDAAWESYRHCERMINDGTANLSSSLLSNIEVLYTAMFNMVSERKDISSMVKYSTLLVKHKRYEEQYVRLLLQCFQFNGMNTPASSVFSFLEKLYDYTNLKDKLVTLKCALQVGQQELADLIKAAMTPEEKEWFEKK